MASADEVMGRGIAAQRLAMAAIEKLVSLGHADELAEVGTNAMSAMEAAIAQSASTNKGLAIATGKDEITAQIESAKARPSFEKSLGL